jgi:CRISPR-associated endoribonuclease Cas6
MTNEQTVIANADAAAAWQPAPNLASIVFTLTAASDTSLPQDTGRLLHGAFLRWLEQAHPKLSLMLHEKNYLRPYTLSGLRGPWERKDGELRISPGSQVWYRLTAIGSQFVTCVQSSIAQQTPGPQLDDPSLVPGPIFQSRREHPAARMTRFASLLRGVYRHWHAQLLTKSVILRFISPTCFVENKQSIPFPLPASVFGYLVKRWQMASPIPLPISDEAQFLANLCVADMHLHTRAVDLQKFQRTGFVGEVRFTLSAKSSLQELITLHLLARFAYYSGVGSHTTMGMGQAMQVSRSKMTRGEREKRDTIN